MSDGRVFDYTVTSGKLTAYRDPTTAAGGPMTNYGYNATSGLLETIDTPGQGGSSWRTKIEYDTSGRVLRVLRYTTTALTASYRTEFGYTAPGFMGPAKTTLTDARSDYGVGGKKLNTVYEMDGDLRVKATIDPLGHRKDQTWSPNGDPASFTDALSNASSLAYNADNLRSSLANPGTTTGSPDTTTSFGYTTGLPDTDLTRYRPASRTSAQGVVTSYGYDTRGNAQSATTNGQATTRAIAKSGVVTCGSAYDGQVCSVTDNGNTTGYTYSGGRLTTVTPPASANPPTPTGASTYTYDGSDRIDALFDGKAQRTCYDYDAADRVTLVSYAANATCTTWSAQVSFAYDKAGNLTQRVDPTGTTTLGFDGLNRPTAKTFPGGSTAAAGYDQVDRLTSHAASGQTTTYAYDDAGRLAWLAETGGACTGGTVSGCSQFRYDDADRRQFTCYGLTTAPPTLVGGGWDTREATTCGSPVLASNFDYGRSGKLTQTQTVRGATNLFQQQYSYLKPGSATNDHELVSKRTDLVAGITTTYGYDARERLATADDNTTGTMDYAYAYDAAGNLTSTTYLGAATSQRSDAQNRLCTLNGTTCPSSSWPTTFDGNGNQLTGNGHTITVNARSQMTTIDGSNYAYADVGNGQLWQSSTGGVTSTNLDWVLGHVKTLNGGASPLYTRLPDGQLHSRKNATGAAEYYLLDVQGSITKMVTAAGTTTAAYTYDPYGAHATATGTSAATNPYRFKSGRHISTGTTGDLYKYGARYYDSGTTKWTQPDPAQDDTNTYRFVENDPINKSDPSGYHSEEDGFWTTERKCVVVGLIAAGVGLQSGGYVGGLLGYAGGTSACLITEL